MGRVGISRQQRRRRVGEGAVWYDPAQHAARLLQRSGKGVQSKSKFEQQVWAASTQVKQLAGNKLRAQRRDGARARLTKACVHATMFGDCPSLVNWQFGGKEVVQRLLPPHKIAEGRP